MALLAIIGLPGCRKLIPQAGIRDQAAFQLSSPSFFDAKIPKSYTCNGSDTAPHLTWTAPPPGTASLALIVIDRDAPDGIFVHWVLYDLPPGTSEIPEGLPGDGLLADSTRQGRNDFGSLGYRGPCPPGAAPHRYDFSLYALNTRMNLQAGATRAQVEDAMKDHVLARAEMTATYPY